MHFSLKLTKKGNLLDLNIKSLITYQMKKYKKLIANKR
jgi:hypothetical protein